MKAHLLRISLIVSLLLLTACGQTNREGASPQNEDTTLTEATRGPSSLDCGGAETSVLTGEGIGALQIGRTVEEVSNDCRVLRDTTEIRAEGMPARVLDVQIGENTVEAEIVEDALWRITIDTPALRTADSLGVGTPASRLAGFEGVRASWGEGDVYVQTPAHCGLSFRLSGLDAAVAPTEWTPEALRSLPEDVRVDRVLAFGCDEPGAGPS